MTDDDDPEDGRNPFGRLDESVGDREGDPFEHLDDEASGADADADSPNRERAGAEAGRDAMPGEFEEVSQPSVEPSGAEPGEDDPFSEAGPDFAEFDLGDVDESAVWEALADAQARGSVADVADSTYAEVSKHRYCERCEYFTPPPRAACTHEGTEILEFVDMETVRVVDCPIVAERRRLEREG